MSVTEIGDARLQMLFGASDPRESGVRPMVRLPRKGLGTIAFAAIALVFAVLLFSVLNARRTSQQQPSIDASTNSSVGTVTWQKPPQLYVPPEEAPAPLLIAAPAKEREREGAMVRAPVSPEPVSLPRTPPPQRVYMPEPVPRLLPPPPAQLRVSAGAPLVIDTTNTPAGGSGVPSTLNLSSEAVTRMRASALANRSTTVTQGTLIPAVLETGFDSSQSGFARAVVSRDVRSFDGTNVLIPRGSKLTGEYRADSSQGQKRATIIWTRLIRPDGMTITMDSPAVDPLGRGGVPASVNTHFFARLGDALLQSSFAIGSALAQRSAAPVVVLSSATTATATPIASVTNHVPTLTVPAGKSISVFVAHDLDFSAAAAPR